MTVHYFKEDLAWSEDMTQWSHYLIFLKGFFPETVDWSRITDLPSQKQGKDIELELPNGIIKIQIKARRRYYPDILIEYGHDFGYRIKPGWIETNTGIDWLLYTIPSEAKAFCIDFKSLQKAWQENKEDWIKLYSLPPVKNLNYNTLNVVVELPVLKDAGVIFKDRT